MVETIRNAEDSFRDTSKDRSSEILQIQGNIKMGFSGDWALIVLGLGKIKSHLLSK